MKIQQLSLFLENHPGGLTDPCRILAEAGISITTLSLADTEHYGILRIIVPQWKEAKAVLEAAGCVVNVTEVVAISVEDCAGGLSAVLSPFEDASVNIEYMYAFTSKKKNRGILVFRFDDPDAAIAALNAKGISVADPMDS